MGLVEQAGSSLPRDEAMENARYAALLSEMSDLLQVVGANPFKVRAFQRAARALEALDVSIEERIDAGTVTELDGIGASIAADLTEMKERGSCGALDQLRAELPAEIGDVLKVQGMGPKKVGLLWSELGIGSLDELQAAAEAGQLEALKGFGKKTVAKILKEIERLRAFSGRTPYADAAPVAARLVAWLRTLDDVERAEIAGSLRRHRETVGDLDFVVASSTPAPIMDDFAAHPEVEEVIAKGETKTSVYLPGNLSADLRVVPPEVFGATLHHFTGSKEHNIAMRARALKRGLRVSEWGVFRRTEASKNAGPTDVVEERIACATEADIFAAVDLPFIPPELREGRGEIEAATSGTLPALVTLEAIRGDLHMHTTASDGKASIAEMAAAGAARGLGYLCITDHSQALTVANGLTPDRLRAQLDEIDALNADGAPLRVLKGLEVDILAEGEIDMEPEVLERCDWVVGSVHSRMSQDATTMTARLIRAVESGLISAIGHPTGRLIGTRDPYSFDVDAVLDACERMNVALEINAAPQRLDLSAPLIRKVLERPSLWLTINTDAHRPRELDQMRHGVGMARRGWAPAARVLNTLELDAFLEARRKPARA